MSTPLILEKHKNTTEELSEAELELVSAGWLPSWHKRMQQSHCSRPTVNMQGHHDTLDVHDDTIT